MPLTESQQPIFEQIVDFINSEEKKVFILKGYAGTGKTTMIKELVTFLDKQEVETIVMAPTGRAAKVLRDKVGRGVTIHKGIYDFDSLVCIEEETEDVSKKSFRCMFPVHKVMSKESRPFSVAIVDESSMISDTENHGEFFTFGSGRLLTDLLEYVTNTGIKKIIFVGDDAQLPPVTENESQALDPNYFVSRGMIVETATMTDVIRQDESSEILSIATEIRSLLSMDFRTRSNFSIEGTGDNVLSIQTEDAAEKYLELYPIPEVGNGVIITYSNAQCFYYNRAIRNRLYGDNADIRPGDVILINNNNYHTFGREIFNGDMAKVVYVGELETHPNIPVSKDKVKKHISLSFRNVELMFPGDERTIQCTILETLLNSKDSDISGDEQRALYIDFCMRHPKLKDGSEDFKLAIRNDRYFNALKVKYGYAITCHKAQGGEWETAFVDYYGRCGLSDSQLRWCYTATTRTKSKMFVINAPHISGFSKLKFSPIVKVNAAPIDFYNKQLEANTAYHADSVPYGVKIKFIGIDKAIKDTPFSIANVQSFPYMERYDFVYNESEHYLIQLYYDKSSIFKRLPVANDGSTKDKLLTIINNAGLPIDGFAYTPSSKVLQELYQRVSTICTENNIFITNIQESPEKYYVIYCFKTDATFAYIQFYYKENGMLTTAMPKSELGEADKQLKIMIEKLS